MHLLPTGSVVMVVRRDEAPVFVMPHGGVRSVELVLECAQLAPHFVKCLLGEPRRFVDTVLPATAHPMLEPFASCRSVDDAVPLWVDLRDSLVVTPDERDFLELWAAYADDPASLPTGDRWVERLCLRYAGQTPKRLKTIAQLAATLREDQRTGRYNSLGAFSDASHYVRVCRALTGHPPTRWRGLVPWW